MKVAVLGCGPAGLLAAHAVRFVTGNDPVVFSKPRKSEMFGAQYLHAEIPMLTATAGTEPTLIKYDLWGTNEDYKAKVYGEQHVDKVSPEDLLGEHYAWDIRVAYDELWKHYWGIIEPVDLNKMSEAQIADLVSGYDLVINSVPRPAVCKAGHQFQHEKVWAIGDAPERGIRCPVRMPINTVVCNGEPEPGWYRASNVFGYCTVEYPSDTQPPYPGAAEVTKPIRTNCDCWPNMMHVGRYGAWSKGVLSHQAFYDVLESLA